LLIAGDAGVFMIFMLIYVVLIVVYTEAAGFNKQTPIGSFVLKAEIHKQPSRRQLRYGIT
jgi:hypothetical protein